MVLHIANKSVIKGNAVPQEPQGSEHMAEVGKIKMVEHLNG